MQPFKVLLTCLVLCVAGCTSVSRVDEARSRVPLGTPRNEAVQILQAGSWYHAICQRQEEVIQDLLFFGSRGYDEAEILIVRSLLQNDSYVVRHIGTFESNAWHTAYKDCIQRDKFQ